MVPIRAVRGIDLTVRKGGDHRASGGEWGGQDFSTVMAIAGCRSDQPRAPFQSLAMNMTNAAAGRNCARRCGDLARGPPCLCAARSRLKRTSGSPGLGPLAMQREATARRGARHDSALPHSRRAAGGNWPVCLSGGEQQMLAVARALDEQTEAICLMDEPSLGLAPQVVDHDFRDLIEELKRRRHLDPVWWSRTRALALDSLPTMPLVLANGAVAAAGHACKIWQGNDCAQSGLSGGLSRWSCCPATN